MRNAQTNGRTRPTQGFKYLAVKQILLERIAAGRYSRTTPVPPEKALGRELGVSAMTARRGIQTLVEDGVLVREVGRGRGTFVRRQLHGSTRRSRGAHLSRIGVVHCGDWSALQASPAYMLAFLELQAECVRSGVHLEFLPVPPEDGPADILRLARQSGCQALVTMRWPRLADLVEVQAAGIPVIRAGRVFGSAALSFVAENDYQGGCLVSQHLLGLGHKHVALIAPDSVNSVMMDRRLGWCCAMNEPDEPEYLLDVAGGDRLESAREQLVAQFAARRPPGALFACNGLFAHAAMLALRELGLECPRDVSVACVGRSFEQALELPRMTTAAPEEGALGRGVVRLAENLLSGRQDGPVGLILPMTLFEGATARAARQGKR